MPGWRCASGWIEMGIEPRNIALDRAKGVCAVLVVLIHAPPLMHSRLPALGWAGWAVFELCQVAVPFFFLTSGWMMGIKWAAGRTGWNELARSTSRLARLYVPWFSLFLLLDVAEGFPQVPWVVLRRFVGFSVSHTETSAYHLWFLPSLILAQTVCWILLRSTRSAVPSLVCGAVLFSAMYALEIAGRPLPFRMVANEGLNLSLPCLSLGIWLGANRFHFIPRGKLVLGSFAILFLEGALLTRCFPGREPVHTFQFSRLVVPAIGLLWLIAHPNASSGRALDWILDVLGRHSTAIYVAHLAFLTLIPFDRLIPNGFIRENFIRWPVGVLGSIALSALLKKCPWEPVRRLVA